MQLEHWPSYGRFDRPGTVYASSGLSCGAIRQAILKGTQSVQCVVQGLIFFNGVSASRKQLSGAGDNGFLGIGDSVWDPALIRLEQGGAVQLSPAIQQRLGGLVRHKTST
jgi:hypothetical protein